MNTSIGSSPELDRGQPRADEPAPHAEEDFAEAARIDKTASRKKSGMTETSSGQQARPRLPHERDESSDSQQEGVRPIIEQARQDIEAGRVDTDRGTPMNEAYKKQQSGGSQTGPKFR